jgi:hypothetical protein
MLDECTQPGMPDMSADHRCHQNLRGRFRILRPAPPALRRAGLAIQDTGDLYQIASHYLDDFTPELQAELSKALHNNLYQIDIFLSEADTLIAKDKFRIGLCSHDAYGIDTVRNPLWSVYWHGGPA